MAEEKLDVVGDWTEIKLKIIQDYSRAYATILNKTNCIKEYGYIDGFAGAGSHIAKSSMCEIAGSPMIALDVKPGFSSYDFIEMDGSRIDRLKELAGGRSNVDVHAGDCNEILLKKVFPKYKYEDYRRALCLLDPYQLNPNWEVILTAGRMKSIEIFLNFMIMDYKMNMHRDHPESVLVTQAERMNKFWGDESWRNIVWASNPGFFGDEYDTMPSDELMKAYQRRLKQVAGFKYVPDPIPMKNSKGPVIYYLFFASHNETGAKIAKSIFDKYRKRGIR